MQGRDSGSVWDNGPVDGDAIPVAPPPTDMSHVHPTSDGSPDRAEPPATPPGEHGSGSDEPPRRGPWWIVAIMVGLLVLVGALIVARSSDDAISTETTVSVESSRSPEQVDTTVSESGGGAEASTAPQTASPAPTSAAPVPTSAPVVTTPVTTPSTTPATTLIAEPRPTSPPAIGPPPTTAALVPVDGPTVLATGREGSCRFGPNCLIVDFVIDGFATQPTEFICEFGDGSRYTFRFNSQGVDGACSTSDAGGEIVVEVDGIRSSRVTR